MGDTNLIEDSPILYKATYLYMNLCGMASYIQTKLNSRQHADAMCALEQFRPMLCELYYLVQTKNDFDEMFDKNVQKEFLRWENMKYNRLNPIKYCKQTLHVFRAMRPEIRRLGVVGM